MTVARRRGALVIEISATGYVDDGHLRAAAWMYRGALGLWADGDDPPEALRTAALHAAVAVGFDLHANICPHLRCRWGTQLDCPRIDLGITMGLTPSELALRFPPRNDLIAMPSHPELASAVRRLLVTDAVWRWLRSRR